MPRFSANISTLFKEVPMLERIGLAAECGFDAIEVQFPYSEDPRAFLAELEKWQMPLALMNFPAGDLLEGGEGLAAIPGREAAFDEAVKTAHTYAELLQPASMNVLAGRPDASRDLKQCTDVFQSSLRKAYAATKNLGIQLVTEPVNTIDMPGFILSGSQQTVDLIEAMPDIELHIQYDIYHMQMMGHDLIEDLSAMMGRVGHIQFSDAPGRTEPKGGIDFERIFQLIDLLGYKGYIGAEYFPTTDTSATLEWLNASRPKNQP